MRTKSYEWLGGGCLFFKVEEHKMLVFKILCALVAHEVYLVTDNITFSAIWYRCLEGMNVTPRILVVQCRSSVG